MLSAVFLSGRLGPATDDPIRTVYVDRVIPEKAAYRIDSFPVRSMLAHSASFYTAKEGTPIVLKGRLEMEQGRLIIVSELEEVGLGAR